MNTNKHKSLVGVLLLSCVSSAGAQDEPITRVTVNEVRFDAVVTDFQGNFVPDLPAEIFSVFQDGKRQKPVHVQYVKASEAPATTQSHELQAGEVTRTIVFIVDDAQMSFASFEHARKVIKQYLEAAMHPGVVAAVVRTSESSSYLDPFQSDWTALEMSIDRMHYRPTLRLAFTPVLALASSTIRVLGRMPGRKTMVIFTDRMPVWRQFDQHPFDVYQRLADAAFRSSVTIYGIDARGLTTPIQIQVPPQADPKEAKVLQQINDAMQPVDANFPPRPSDPRLALGRQFDAPPPPPAVGDMEGLVFLAGETGGLMLADTNDLGASLRTAMNDQAGYYLISWNPGEKAFEQMKGTPAAFHNVNVKVTRPGLKVRTAQGFYGVETSVAQARRSPRMAMQEALLEPFQSGRFDAQMNSDFDIQDGRPIIRSDVFIAGKDIVFRPYPDARRNDCYSIKLEFLTLPQPIDSEVDTLAESRITSLEVCGSFYQEMSQKGLAVEMKYPVEKPGGYEMRLAVRNVREEDETHSLSRAKDLVIRDDIDQPVGSAHQLVVVPDWRTAPAIFGLQMSAEHLPPYAPDPRDAGPAEKVSSLAYRAAESGDPSVRAFRPEQKVLYSARVANIAEPAVQIRISRANAPDTAMFTDDAGPVKDGVVSGSVTIDKSWAPGSYDLQLNIAGKDSDGRLYSGTQEIDFGVTDRE